MASSTSFRPVKVRGHLAYKSCTLQACAALHPLGQSNLLVCKGCKVAAYCSRSCQKIDWPNHRTVCNFQRRQPARLTEIMTSTGLTAEELTRLLNDFRAVHLIPMNSVMRSHIGDICSFPYASQSFVFQLTYRMDCRGNPALAFRVESATLHPRSTLSKDVRDGLEASKGTMDAMKVRLRAEQSGFVDILPVVFSFGKQRVIEPLAVYDRHSSIQYTRKGRGFFLYQLQILSEKGHAYREVGEGESVIGQMEKRGNKWNWVPLTAEEVEAAGYLNGLEFVESDDDS